MTNLNLLSQGFKTGTRLTNNLPEALTLTHDLLSQSKVWNSRKGNKITNFGCRIAQLKNKHNINEKVLMECLKLHQLKHFSFLRKDVIHPSSILYEWREFIKFDYN